MKSFNHGDRVAFGYREHAGVGSQRYVFGHYTGTVDFAFGKFVDVTSSRGEAFRFTRRTNGEFAPQGQTLDPKGRNCLVLVEETL